MSVLSLALVGWSKKWSLAWIAIERSYHYSGWHFLDVVMWFLDAWTEKHSYTTYDCVNRVFHADAVTNIASIVVFLISTSLWWYLCSCTYTMSMLCSTTDAVSSGCWSILFKVLTLNVAFCIMFCGWFFEYWGQCSNRSKRRPFFTCTKGDTVWTHGLSESHGNLSMALF